MPADLEYLEFPAAAVSPIIPGDNAIMMQDLIDMYIDMEIGNVSS